MIRPRFWRGRSDYFFFRAAFLAFFAFLAIAALSLILTRNAQSHRNLWLIRPGLSYEFHRKVRGKQVGNDAAVARIKAVASERAENLKAIVEDIRAQGVTSVRTMTDELNHRGILTARGGEWHPTTVARLLDGWPLSRPLGAPCTKGSLRFPLCSPERPYPSRLQKDRLKLLLLGTPQRHAHPQVNVGDTWTHLSHVWA